jgi:CubicO group peptidase (beta-lactamase class C family)
VEHLLSHTSGGEPGSRYSYSGDRFAKLDRVLEKAAGRSFASLLRERILDPAGLADTAPNPGQPSSCLEARRDPEIVAGRMARGYDPGGETAVEYRKHFVTAAGLVSTAADMARFSIALDDGRLLQERSVERMFSPAVSPAGAPLPYALGWFVQEVNGRKLAWHYGWWTGASSLIIKDLARRRTFVLLANSDGLSREFDLDDGDLERSPFAREVLAFWKAGDELGPMP